MGMYKELVVSLCLLCCNCVSGAIEQAFYKVYKGYEVTDFYDVRSVQSLSGCATYCNRTAGCFTATYDASTHKCLLSDMAVWVTDNTGNLNMKTLSIVPDNEICINPPIITNGTLNVTRTPHGSYVTLTCDPSYRLALNSSTIVNCTLGYGWGDAVTDMGCEFLNSNGYYGTSFVLAFMKNDGSGSSGVPTLMITSQIPTTVRVEIPFNGIDVEYPVYGTLVTPLPVSITMTTTGIIMQKAVFVTSENLIQVSYYNFDSETSDGSVVFPTSALGNAYFMAGHLGWGPFIMVSLNDATQVTLQYPSGQTETIVLNTNDTYFAGHSDLTGTKVSATEPIFLTSGQLCTNIVRGYCDYLDETMPPVTSLGTIHIVSFMKPRPDFDISIVATKDSTYVSIYDNTGNVIETVQGLLQTSSAIRSYYGYKTISVISNNPIMIHQYGHGSNGAGGDPSMMFIPDVTFFGQQYDFVIPQEFWSPSKLTVVIADSSASLLEMNGLGLVTTQSVSVIVPGHEPYLVLYADVVSSYNTLTHQSSAAFGAWVYGRLPMAEFAWTLGYAV